MPKTLTFVRPKVAAGRHPIETTRYLLGTAVIDDFCSTICRWIDNRVPGGIIYGDPRLGKTRAIHYLSKALPEILEENISVISFSCREYRIVSESTFFEDLLRASGHALAGNGRASAKRDRLREFLCEKVYRSGQDRLIFFIDEAQKLHELQYKWLIDLHNELDELGISLIFLLIGQRELLHQYSAFLLSRKSQIIGRFMIHQHEFLGLSGLKDVVVCLNGYDEYSEFPVESEWSFTRYFYPAIYALGWRLVSAAEDLWAAFLQIRSHYGFSDKPNIPMQYFCRTVELILKQYSTLGDLPPNLSINVWKDAINHSGYVEAEERYVEEISKNSTEI